LHNLCYSTLYFKPCSHGYNFIIFISYCWFYTLSLILSVQLKVTLYIQTWIVLVDNYNFFIQIWTWIFLKKELLLISFKFNCSSSLINRLPGIFLPRFSLEYSLLNTIHWMMSKLCDLVHGILCKSQNLLTQWVWYNILYTGENSIKLDLNSSVFRLINCQAIVVSIQVKHGMVVVE